jgi:hypothetical protein
LRGKAWCCMMRNDGLDWASHVTSNGALNETTCAPSAPAAGVEARASRHHHLGPGLGFGVAGDRHNPRQHRCLRVRSVPQEGSFHETKIYHFGISGRRFTSDFLAVVGPLRGIDATVPVMHIHTLKAMCGLAALLIGGAIMFCGRARLVRAGRGHRGRNRRHGACQPRAAKAADRGARTQDCSGGMAG